MRSLGDTLRLPKNSGENHMSAMLFSYRDRDEAHRKLEEVRTKEGVDSKAECRENPNEVEPYQVWSGPSA